jgi:phosphate transport system substrate-binding protein
VLPIIHKGNAIRSLSLTDLGRIYRGEIDNWQQLGGEDRSIVIVSRDTSSGTFTTWQELVMTKGGVAAGALVAESNREVVELVSRQRGAIGYIGLGYLSANVRPVSVDGVMGSLRTMRDGSYAITRSLFLFTDGWPSGVTLDFINYVLDPDGGQRVVERAGFIPLYQHQQK